MGIYPYMDSKFYKMFLLRRVSGDELDDLYKKGLKDGIRFFDNKFIDPTNLERFRFWVINRIMDEIDSRLKKGTIIDYWNPVKEVLNDLYGAKIDKVFELQREKNIQRRRTEYMMNRFSNKG
jgi:hypothetical protein